MQVVLVMFKGESERRSFSVARDVTVVGRREDCDLRIPLGEVSRKHCRLIKDGNTLRVEDLGSSNGTYHNGQRVQEATIEPGDSIRIGSVSFIVQIDGQPLEDQMTPPAASNTSAGAGTDEHAGHAETALVADNDEFDPMSALNSEDSAAEFDLGGLSGSGDQAASLEQIQPDEK